MNREEILDNIAAHYFETKEQRSIDDRHYEGLISRDEPLPEFKWHWSMLWT